MEEGEGVMSDEQGEEVEGEGGVGTSGFAIASRSQTQAQR